MRAIDELRGIEDVGKSRSG